MTWTYEEKIILVSSLYIYIYIYILSQIYTYIYTGGEYEHCQTGSQQRGKYEHHCAQRYALSPLRIFPPPPPPPPYSPLMFSHGVLFPFHWFHFCTLRGTLHILSVMYHKAESMHTVVPGQLSSEDASTIKRTLIWRHDLFPPPLPLFFFLSCRFQVLCTMHYRSFSVFASSPFQLCCIGCAGVDVEDAQLGSDYKPAFLAVSTMSRCLKIVSSHLLLSLSPHSLSLSPCESKPFLSYFLSAF